MTEPGLSSADVCRLVDVTYRQLNRWTARGYVVPSIHRSNGSGTPHRYAVGDLEQVRKLAARSADIRRGLQQQ